MKKHFMNFVGEQSQKAVRQGNTVRLRIASSSAWHTMHRFFPHKSRHQGATASLHRCYAQDPFIILTLD